MSRKNGLGRFYASASATAVLGLLVGCSQPASYATVDLGGSYGNGAQAYSARSGLPVYQATQVYTTPYDSGPAQSQSQLVYLDAPSNQVASLSPNYGSYGSPVQQSYPVFGAEQPGPYLTDETILRSDGYLDTGVYGGVQTAALAPGAGSIGFDRMPVMNDVPQYLPAPQPIPAPQAYTQPAPLPYSAPAMVETVPLPPPAPMIRQDYTYENYETFPEPNIADSRPVYAPMAEPIETAPLEMMQAPPQVFAALPAEPYTAPPMPMQMPSRDSAQEVGDYYNLRDAQQPLEQVQQARLPAAVPMPSPSPRVFSAPDGGGIALPSASGAYPRPYEALPPGFFPTYEFPSGNDMISQAPAPVAEAPLQLASIAPQAPLDDTFIRNDGMAAPMMPPVQQAAFGFSSDATYTIQSGDTLYGIARMHGVTPLDIAQANDLPLAGTIYPGDTLSIPSQQQAGGPQTLGDAPIVVLQTAEAASISTFTTDLSDQPVDMIDIAQLARMFRDRENGQPGAGLPIISADAGNAMRGRVNMTPTERLVEPIAPVMTTTIIPNSEFAAPMTMATPAAVSPGGFSWPVHGEVYRLQGGGIEIAAPAGRTVTAAAAGRIVHVENGPRGYLVVIEHDDGWRSLTLGLSRSAVQPGERVFGGATLGYTGEQRVTFELRDGASNVAEALGVLRS